MASKDFPVAIIGITVRLPGAESCDEFWKLLIERQNTVSEFPENRTSDVHHILSAFQSSLLNENDPFCKGSYFKSVDKFDAGLFSINPEEAVYIEPEHSFFLEIVWELIEDAGYACKLKGTKTGVYTASTASKYNYILSENHSSTAFDSNYSTSVSSFVSCAFDLSGPAMMVATGCSSSLMAVHLACQGLLSKDCEMAIAGGITLDLLPLKTDTWNRVGTAWSSFKNQALHADNKGVVRGEGCGAVLLKPLDKAMIDGDFIYAVLEASIDNQGGHLSASRSTAQTNLLCQAWDLAKISPNSIGCFEAHAFECELDKSVEVSGITTAFTNLGIKSRDKIPVSSVKANIGDLADGGAGIVALIKVVLCLTKGKIPPSIDFSKPNHQDAAPVYVNTTLLEWKPNGSKPRYAGVNTFDLHGTNVHVVVRGFVNVALPKGCLPTTITNEILILAMAAKSQQSLYKFICKIAHYIKTSPNKNMHHLRNICYTVNTSREQNKFSYKAIVYAPNVDKMIKLLEKLVDTHFDLKDMVRKDVKSCHSNSGYAAFYKCCSINLESAYPYQQNCEAIASFLKGEVVNWLQFYQEHADLKRVPLVPTYAFDRKRFWPATNELTNTELSQLECQVKLSNKKFSDDKKDSTHCTTGINVTNLLNCSNYSGLRGHQLTSYNNLSIAQHRMLIMQETAPNSTAYVETIAYYTTNKVNPAVVFRNILEQHPILASRIDQDCKGMNLTISIKQENVSCNVELELIKSFEDASIYLTNSIPVMKVISSPLSIFRLLKVEDKIIIVLHIHHIIADDITTSNIACDLYNTMNETAVEHYPFSHRASIENELIYLKSSQMNLDKDFWSQVFLTLPPEVNLSILPKGECTWNDTVVYKAKHISKLIPSNITKDISRFCNSLEIIEFHFYMACTALVVQRYLGTHEVTLAVPVSTRTDLNQMADGLFVNTVLFRISADIDSSVKGYMQTIAQSWLQVLDHSQYPFNEIVNTIWKQHGKRFSTFCCVLFNHVIQNRPSKNELPVIAKHAKIPLSINVVHNNDSSTTKLMCEWAPEMIDDGIIERLTEGIFEIFQKILNNSNSKINDIQVLSFSECNLLNSFSQPYQGYEVLNINETFKNHVKTYPNSVAVICKGNTTTYFQLEAMALLIASKLYQHVDQATLKANPVILISDKSEYAIASILGIWKSGGHFLPVSSNTSNSLNDILECVTPAAIFVSDSVDSDTYILSKQHEVPIINICTLLIKHQFNYHIDFCYPIICENDLVYVIRTSGSTGKPKQCKISHKSLGILASAWKTEYRMSEFEIKILQWAPLSFDVFIGDLIRGLVCSPGTLFICPDELRLDIPYLLKQIKEQNITIAEITPQFAMQLVQNSKHEDLESLKLLILGSDILQTYIYKKVKEHLKPNQRAINSYGMTEATIDSTFFEGNIPNTKNQAVPIGKPLPGVAIHVLDPKTLHPCPVGTIGELYISGPVLASGDAEVMHIESVDCVCLKTNDAAAWLPSGDIEHLGRLDRVTKLRGFRISTTEIENKILSNVSGVKDACVVVLSSENVDNGNKFLCTFIVQETNHILDLATLRNQLNGKLPYYMLPDIVYPIEMIPLSRNGKVDLKALPSLSEVLKSNDRQQNTVEHINAESLVHFTLKELFSEALGSEISHIHLDKTFMEQGGHSLILLYFATLVKERTTYDIGIADIFSYPSIKSLAAYIQKANQTNMDLGDSIEKQPKFECNDDIAITGIGLRLPGGIMSLPQLWQALKEGDNIIRDFSKERISDFLNCLPLSSSSICSDTDTYQGAFLEAIDQFDCQFFKIAPNEANFMSPEQRLFLQVATEALAEGRDLSEVKGAKIGVFVGQCDVKYAELNHPDEAICKAGMIPGMVATRVAYQWDLKGPSMLVDTACSSSLMALKQACESMRNGECEGALVGGVNLVLYPARKRVFGKGGILSSDFHCRPFDNNASGNAVGEGILCIYAQPLQNALKERKHIYGIVKNIASNNVGHGSGITISSSISQQSVIKEALNGANVSPSDISFVECHGTGTVHGDKIELSAITSIFNHALPIGSIKSMFGHLDSAAGLLGLFKVLASLMAKQIPPTLHFKTPHPELQNTLIYVPSTTINWNTNNTGKRIAGLSSFGLTGTNCHAIIAEPQINSNEVNLENSAGLTHYPLLLCGKNLKHVKKQVSLHQIHIQELILNTKRHTLLQLCITVAKRLKELNSTGIGHNECRMIITAKNAEQMMIIMKVIMNTENVESFFQLFTQHSDLYFCSAEYKYTGTAYEGFLVNGKINLGLLFPDVTGHDVSLASCVTLALYNESRYWLEHSFTQDMIDSDTENLLSLLHKKANETRELIRMLPLGSPKDLKQTQGRFCSAIIIQLFLSTNLAVYLQNDKIITLNEAFKCTSMLQKYDKLFFIMIRELFENDLIQAVGKNESIRNLDSFYFKCKDILDVGPETIANYATDKYPLWADCFRFPLYCSKSLHDILMGKMSPLSVIYPQGDLNFTHQFDKLGDLLGDVYYNMYMQLIATYAKNLSRKGNKVRILEVGAGVGYVTRQLLPKLKEVPNIEYWFTDLGKGFVDRAKTIFTDYNFMMKFSTFDITKNPTMQGILGSFDIVISYNVIHTTESILVSVANLRSCLGENGVLFIIESVMNETWATLAWGILDGWWHFKDYELRKAEPMLEPNQWEMVLGKVGFASIYSFPTNTNEREHVKKFLFICSAKKLQAVTDVNQPEWWESTTHEFQPATKRDKINYKDQKYNEVVNNEDLLSINNSADATINESMIYKELKDIWSELLGVKDIQPDDNFNFLGGESLQMMHLVSKKIGYQLEIADALAYPTLQALASFIHEKLSEKHLLTNHSIRSGISENEAKFHDDSLVVETKTHRVLLMFPGQGAEKVGMCVSMKDSPPAVEIFTRAKQILGYDVLEICTNKDTLLTEKLTSTEFVQVTLFLSCIAKVEQLKYEKPELMKQVTHVAGLSVGEFVALVYAGVLKFEDALRFIKKRGEAMENDVKKYSTGMISIFGPTLAQLQEFMENHFPTMTISTYLGDNQHTIAGTEEECQTFMQMISETNVCPSKMEVIDVKKVAGAFHSPHMEQAATLLDPILDNITFSKPLLPVIMNVNGKVVEDPLEIKLMSRKQLIAAVEWKQSIITAYKCGIRNFVEIAPTRVLSSLVEKRISECQDCDVTYINV